MSMCTVFLSVERGSSSRDAVPILNKVNKKLLRRITLHCG